MGGQDRRGKKVEEDHIVLVGGNRGGSCGNVIVAAAAASGGDQIPQGTLVWALTHVVQPGDSVTLLVVVVDNSLSPRRSSCSSTSSVSGRKFWAFPRFSVGCTTDDRKSPSGSLGDRLTDIADAYSCMILQRHGLFDSDKTSLKTKIVQGTPPGMVASEAKKVRANWVVLDKHLKGEVKHCFEELQCNIVVMKRSKPKVLRLNLLGPPKGESSHQATTESPTEPNESPGTRVATPGSNPELGMPFTVTEAGTSHTSSYEKGMSSSPPFVAKIVGYTKVILPLIRESKSLEWYDSHSEGETQPLFSTSLRFEQRATSHFIEEVLHTPNAKFVSIIGQGKLKYGSEAASLCSICQHKAPQFGKPPRGFTFSELQRATGGFSSENFLAEGGFGFVHRGVLPDGQVIAVKQHKLASSQGDREFYAEVEILSRAQHRNVVMLIGFCIQGEKRLLVYEYVCNGSLDSHLYRNHQHMLSWHSRKKIATGTARGLRYLHEECRVGCIIHRDMRPNNILVTHDFEPLVGDFGLARWQPKGESAVQTQVLGTFGYLAPEYAQTGQITERADVYSFGVVLLELLTGRKAVDLHRPKGQQCLVEWARHMVKQGAIDKLIDPRLEEKYPEHEVQDMLQAALSCISQVPESRPRMSQVLRILEGDDAGIN